MEALPAGWMLVFANLDLPGVIGRIGTDDSIPEAILREIRAMPDIVFAKLVKL